MSGFVVVLVSVTVAEVMIHTMVSAITVTVVMFAPVSVFMESIMTINRVVDRVCFCTRCKGG